MSVLALAHRVIEFLPVLARFAILMALIVVIPRFSRRVSLPEAVGLLLSGVVLGPHMLDVFPREHPVADFFSELGMLLLMFLAGLEIDLTLFRQKIFRSIVFGADHDCDPVAAGDAGGSLARLRPAAGHRRGIAARVAHAARTDYRGQTRCEPSRARRRHVSVPR